MNRLILALLVVCFAADAVAQGPEQDRRERRRQFVEGLFKSLVESQQPPSPPPPDSRRPAPFPPPSSAQRLPDLREARTAMRSFADEAQHLVVGMSQQVGRAPSLRPLFADVVKIRAGAEVVAQRSRDFDSHERFAREFQPLDSQWRLLSNQLHNFEDFPNDCLACVRELDAIDQRLCGMLALEPQLDRAELARLTVGLATNVRNMEEGIANDFGLGNNRRQLVFDCRTLEGQCDVLTRGITAGAPRQAILADYKSVADQWGTLAGNLRAVDDRYMWNDMRRIAAVQRDIEKQLWLKPDVDRRELRHLARLLEEQFDRFCAGVSLRELMTLPNAAEAFDYVQEFRTTCHSFSASAAGNSGIGDLTYDYRVLQAEWDSVNRRFDPLRSVETQRQLADVGLIVDALRESLGVRPVVDYQEAQALASALCGYSVQLEHDLQNSVVNDPKYPPQFRRDLTAAVSSFHKAAHELQECVVNRAPDDQIRQHCRDLDEHFGTIRGQASRLIGSDKARYAQSGSQIAPALAKLQLVFEE